MAGTTIGAQSSLAKVMAGTTMFEHSSLAELMAGLEPPAAYLDLVSDAQEAANALVSVRT